MKALLTGWFSFPDMGTTAGDIISKDIVCAWLHEGGVSYDVAAHSRFNQPGSVDWKEVSASEYTDLVFICGPFGNGWPVTELLERFSHCRFTGINLSLLQSLHEWDPFDLLMERDHAGVAQPDITFAGEMKKVPLVGVILAHKQKEYGSRALHDEANSTIGKLIESREMSVVPIDTSLSDNKGGLRTAAEVESLIAAMDMVITTRLHGTVLALKNHIPVIPVDPILGGAKISLQVKALEWPVLFQAPDIHLDGLKEAFDFCKSPEAVTTAKDCSSRAKRIIARRKDLLLSKFISQTAVTLQE